MKCFKKIVPTIIVGCIMCSIFSFSASATAVMVQKTGNAFDKTFTYSAPIYTIGTNFKVGYLQYGFEKRTFATDRDLANCTCENDYSHFSVLVNGIGSSGGSNYYTSPIQGTHGNARINTSHRGPTVSYGGTIDVT